MKIIKTEEGTQYKWDLETTENGPVLNLCQGGNFDSGYGVTSQRLTEKDARELAALLIHGAELLKAMNAMHDAVPARGSEKRLGGD